MKLIEAVERTEKANKQRAEANKDIKAVANPRQPLPAGNPQQQPARLGI